MNVRKTSENRGVVVIFECLNFDFKNGKPCKLVEKPQYVEIGEFIQVTDTSKLAICSSCGKPMQWVGCGTVRL